MIKICCITAARSEYGLLKWLMKDLQNSDEFDLQLIVTGAHLSYEQGHTIDEILNDGFIIDYIVDAQLDTSATVEIAKSMGRMAEGIAIAFEKLKPDYILVLGDRYEMLPICNAAFVMRIPIIHLSGGDITEGAIDDGIRNAVTMLAEYHFPSTGDAANNIIRMRGNDKNIWIVGEPGLDSFNREELFTRKETAEKFQLDIERKWVLMTYHAETKKTMRYNFSAIRNCIEVLLNEDDLQIVITYANADFGGKEINKYIEKVALSNQDKIKVIPSLGHLGYLSYMKQAYFVIGNSSSGIIETPFMNIPTINIGDRQKGRYQCGNIIQCSIDRNSIEMSVKAIGKTRNVSYVDLNYWGDGHTSEKIVGVLKGVLKQRECSS